MSSKEIDLGESVYALCTKHPELVELMKELGFTDILKPGMLQTAGRFMTIPKGAEMKGIDMEIIAAKLTELGYTIA